MSQKKVKLHSVHERRYRLKRNLKFETKIENFNNFTNNLVSC